MSERPEEITRLLNQAVGGDKTAAREVMPHLYEELRRLAGSLRGRLPSGETLRVTALVHEAYLRIAEKEPDGWKARSHFFFAAARSMRDILVEEARRKATKKRGGDIQMVDVDDVELAMESPAANILALHDALTALETEDPDGFQIVMLRYFAGLTVREVAEVVGTSTATVERKWRFMRAWLRNELGPAS